MLPPTQTYLKAVYSRVAQMLGVDVILVSVKMRDKIAYYQAEGFEIEQAAKEFYIFLTGQNP